MRSATIVKTTGVVLTLLILVGAEALALFAHRSMPPSDVRAAEQYWSEEIARHGAHNAYERFKHTYADAGPDIQHAQAHIFGGALFEVLGETGLATCDAAFSFGCFHEFLGRAINAGGLGVVGRLNEACHDILGGQSLSCQHGIGHGVQTYAGYEESGLYDALAVCASLSYSDPIGGCFGGAFMEYNMRTMLSLDGIGVRKRDPREPAAALCDRVDESTRRACYYWMPQWWGVTLPGPLEERAETMGKICRGAESTEVERSCFEGIGNIIGQSAEYRPAYTVKLCSIAAAGTHAHAVYCRASAANAFWNVPSVRDQSRELCAGLSGAHERFCIGYSTNTFNQATQAQNI